MDTYKRMKVDGKTVWCAESIMSIRWRNASGGRPEFGKRRTFRFIRGLLAEYSVERERDIPKGIIVATTGDAGPRRARSHRRSTLLNA